MTHAIATNQAQSTAPRARIGLFKRDHPRGIDQYINYFGGAAGDSTGVDQCGEALLESLEGDDRLELAP